MQIRAVTTERIWRRDKSRIARGHRYRGHSISSQMRRENRKTRRDWNYQPKPLSYIIFNSD